MDDQMTRMRELIAEHRSKLNRSPRMASYIITVTSGKGGVGKSTVALNMAFLLSKTGHRVLLVDGDVNLGNLDVMMGISTGHRIGEVIRGEYDIEDILVSVTDTLKLLPSNSGESKYVTMTAEKQRNLFRDLRSLEEPFDYIIIDSATGISPEIIGFALNADETVVVTSSETTAVLDAYAVIKVLLMNHYENNIGVVVNGVVYPPDADDTVKKLQIAVDHFLRRTIQYHGLIPFDQNVKRSIDQQKILAEGFPSTAATLSLQSIAQKIIEVQEHNVENVEMTL
jgi:flagellar biosynthesis protein FlhG